jgi:hypothetical protein
LRSAGSAGEIALLRRNRELGSIVGAGSASLVLDAQFGFFQRGPVPSRLSTR